MFPIGSLSNNECPIMCDCAKVYDSWMAFCMTSLFILIIYNLIRFSKRQNIKYNFFCQKNKSKLIQNSHPGFYQLVYSCNEKYIGESMLEQCIEHEPGSMSGKREIIKL